MSVPDSSPALAEEGLAPAALSAPVDSAIARVLAAEQAARAAVSACAAQATELVQQAQEQARLIAERGAVRAAFAHEWTSRTIAARLAAIENERRALGTEAEPSAGELRRLAAAVEQVAATLTGGEGL